MSFSRPLSLYIILPLPLPPSYPRSSFIIFIRSLTLLFHLTRYSPFGFPSPSLLSIITFSSSILPSLPPPHFPSPPLHIFVQFGPSPLCLFYLPPFLQQLSSISPLYHRSASLISFWHFTAVLPSTLSSPLLSFNLLPQYSNPILPLLRQSFIARARFVPKPLLPVCSSSAAPSSESLISLLSSPPFPLFYSIPPPSLPNVALSFPHRPFLLPFTSSFLPYHSLFSSLIAVNIAHTP